MKYKAILMVGIMLLSIGSLFGVPNVAAADKGYLEVDEEYGAMNNRYVNYGNSYDLGDEDITFSISVENTECEYDPDVGWGVYQYEITDLTITITDQKDSNDNPVNILDFSDGENEVEYNGLIRTSAIQLGNFEADVATEGEPGTYTLGVRFEYTYHWFESTGALTYDQHNESGTDTDYVLINIDDGLSIGSEVMVFNEHNSIVGHYLYAGSTFQKVGVYVRTNVGKIGQVSSTLTLSPQTKSYLTLDNPTAYTSQISAGNSVYFKYRVDVKDGTLPGRYDATVQVQYERWYGDDDQTTIITQNVEVEFIVDFTPLLTITSPESYTVTQGALSTNLTEVSLENIGNTELKKINVWIDIWNYFEQNDFYYDGDGGNKVLLPTEDEKENLGKGETWQVDFMNINVFKFLPAGEHRLPLEYEGYFYDDGTAGGSSDYKLTDDGTYMAIKEEDIYITVIVTDPTHNFDVSSSTSINLGTRMKDVSVSFSVTNKEAVDVLYSTVKLGTSDGDKTLLINPINPGSDYLEPIEVTRFYGESTRSFTMNADIVQSATEGFYRLPVSISGINENTKQSVSVQKEVVIRVNPEPPRLIVIDVRYPPDISGKINPGKEFTLEIDVRNDGEDYARDVFVTLLEDSKSGVAITTDFTPDAVKTEGMLEPFSTEVSKIYIGDIGPGQTTTVNYTVKADENLVKGKNYEEWVTVDYSDDLSRRWSYNTEISIAVKGDQPVEEADYSGVTEPLGVGVLLIIIVFVLVLLWVKFINRPKDRFGSSTSPLGESEPTERESKPLPPPPEKSSTPPPPSSEQQTQSEPGAETFKVCPACHKSVPSNKVTCPHCGCAL